MENFSTIEPWALNWINNNAALTRALQASLPSSSYITGSKLTRNPMGAGASPSSAAGRISKRKPRASKRSPTTYIAADPANFRRMVHLVTGVGHDATAAAQWKAEPAPAALLPTLDTSGFLLDRVARAEPGGFGSVGPVTAENYGFGFEPFPTLESWSVV